MGEATIRKESDPEELRAFMRKVLTDLRALEKMLAEDAFEDDVTRIGAEQELFLVDRSQRPAPKALEVLEAIGDPHFTTELASFNLEANLDPIVLGEHSLSQLEADLDDKIAIARRGAAEVGVEVVLTGILPTLDKSDLAVDNMTPLPRYFALADATARLRGGEFKIFIKGRDELKISHDSVMAEACNTSFQVHFQVAPSNFARLYNIAQALAAPVLAVATNSPLLFGKRLWRETRIAVFRQSVDTRPTASHRRHLQPRVSFGEHWLDDSVVEIFRADIARFRLLVSNQHDEDPFERLAAGEVPKLKALCLHNGTVYRWNRPCYGITDGKPHLRIENRVLPSGPTVVDEVANAAFWLGAIKALTDNYGDIRRQLEFDAVKENFLDAARRGLRAQLRWTGRHPVAAPELIVEELLPAAREGLRALGVDGDESDRYLDVIEERARSQRTGSSWLLGSLTAMGHEGSLTERLACLTAATIDNQKRGEPVHDWPLAELSVTGGRQHYYADVRSLMTTDLFTVNKSDVIDLAASLMDWRHIRHVPVEDNSHRLVGLVTHRGLLRTLAEHHGKLMRPIAVRDVMHRPVVTVAPQTTTLEAIALMREHQISCLPVVENDRLVGIMTERDLIRVSTGLLEGFLRREGEKPGGGETS